MSLKRNTLKTLKSIRESAESDLPTHASDAGVEIPDSAEKRGNRAIKSALNGKAIADASGKKGSAAGREIPEEVEDDEKLDEGADEDLPTHASDAAVQIPEKRKLRKEDDDKMAKLRAMKEEDEDKEELDEDEDKEELDEEEDEDKMAKLRAMKESDESDEDDLKEEEDKEELDEEEDEDKMAKLRAMKEEEEDKKDAKLSEEEEKELEEEDEEELKKHVEALTSDEDLPESFKKKAATIFEAAVKASAKKRTDLFRKKLSEVYKKKLNKRSSKISEKLVNKVDGYLDYVVEEWIKENEVAIETGLKTQIVEKFIGGLKNLFETHYIEVPATKTDVLAEQANKIDGLEKELNESLNKNVEIRKRLISLEKQSVIKKLSAGLTVSEAAKFSELCEGVSFEDAKAFSGKLAIVRETYFPKTSKRSGDLDSALLTEGGLQEPESRTSKDEIDLAVDTISRMVKK